MSLLTSLEGYWKLDEASGNRADSHGANTLSDNNTVLSATGKLNSAADFERGNSEFLSCADNASLSVGGTSWTFSAWINLESNTALMAVLAKVGANDHEYDLIVRGDLDGIARGRVTSASGFANVVTVTGTSPGALSTGQWYFLVYWLDISAQTLNLQINNGTVNSVACTHQSYDSTAQFRIGDSATNNFFFDGLIDEVGFWKRVLTTQERTDLYNGGNGLAYPFTTATRLLSLRRKAVMAA